MYEDMAQFAQTWGLLYFFLIFAGAVLYALWPSNRRRFDEASKIPLRED